MTRSLWLAVALSAAPALAAGTVTFHQGSWKGPVATSFKAGDEISALATLSEGTVGDIMRGAVVPVSLSAKGHVGGYGGIEVSIPEDWKGDKSTAFAIVGPKVKEHTLKTLLAWLKKLGDGPVEITVEVGFSGQAVGTFTLDLGGPGVAAWDRLVTASEEATLAANANVPFPKANAQNPALEAEARKALLQAHPQMKIHRVILTDADWSIVRDERGKIVAQSRYVALLSTNPQGLCLIEPAIALRRDHLGGGKYGPVKQGGGTAVDPIKIPCSRFKGL